MFLTETVHLKGEMYQIFASFKYIVLFISLLMRNVFLEIADGTIKPDVTLLGIPPDKNTNQKTTKVCANTMISFSHFVTHAECADQVRLSGPHGMIFTETTGVNLEPPLTVSLKWNYHKYYDGKDMRTDLAIVRAVGLHAPMGNYYTKCILSIFCPTCFDACYTTGWGTFGKSEGYLQIKNLTPVRSELLILKEDLVAGSSTEISAQALGRQKNVTVDLGSPLLCEQKIKKITYTGLIGVLTEKTADNILKFRTVKGLLTWASSVAEGTFIAPDGKLDRAIVCGNTNCDTYKGRMGDDLTARSDSSILSHHFSFYILILSINAM